MAQMNTHRGESNGRLSLRAPIDCEQFSKCYQKVQFGVWVHKRQKDK
jgi:hypothetical protein